MSQVLGVGLRLGRWTCSALADSGCGVGRMRRASAAPPSREASSYQVLFGGDQVSELSEAAA